MNLLHSDLETGNVSHSECIPRPPSAEHHREVYTAVLRTYSTTWENLTSERQKELASTELHIQQVCNDADVCETTWPICLKKAYQCYLGFWKESRDQNSEKLCPVSFDGHLCWEPQLPGVKSLLPCESALGVEISNACRERLPLINLGSLHAVRECGLDGTWVNEPTNYTACQSYMDICLGSSDNCTNSTQVPDLFLPETLRSIIYVFVALAVVSLVLLAISLFIFSYFRTLYCNRNSIHKNLIAALMLQIISLFVIMSPKISFDTTIHTEAWLCKSFMFLNLYAIPASIMWTFVEGLYLSQRLTLAVFKKEAPFKIYYFIGWGIPLILSTAWALVTDLVPYSESGKTAGKCQQVDHNQCWGEYSKQPFHWIITGPCIAALVVNFMFLIMIIIVLVTKLRANNAVETVQVRKAIKATFILVPLLGISNLLFVANPNDRGFGEKAYVVVNLVLKGSQGIFVALIYCFLNSEVQMAVQKKFYRAALRRNPETQSFRFGSIHNGDGYIERRKSSTRTGSTTVVSSTEMQRIRSLASKRPSLPAPHHVRFTSFPQYYRYPRSTSKESRINDCYV